VLKRSETPALMCAVLRRTRLKHCVSTICNKSQFIGATAYTIIARRVGPFHRPRSDSVQPRLGIPVLGAGASSARLRAARKQQSLSWRMKSASARGKGIGGCGPQERYLHV
jgi:hypothetical protein